MQKRSQNNTFFGHADAAIRLAVALRYPFGAVAMPGKTDFDFFACDAQPSGAEPRGALQTSHQCDAAGACLEIGCFDPSTPVARIRRQYSPDEFVCRFGHAKALGYPAVVPTAESTAMDDYALQAASIIGNLKGTGGKTVLSTLISLDSDLHPVDTAARYFERFPDTFRFIYYTPATGLWIGASPELLLDVDRAAGEVRTMSLAGTRSASCQGPWDDKNLHEHQFVTDFVMVTLRGLGLDPHVYSSAPQRFGQIEHLCDRISAKISPDTDPREIVRTLSPTPALCGMPRDDAFRQILASERHRRHCYGGWIAVSDATRYTAFVNLRSALAGEAPARHADGTQQPLWRYNIYSGGGLVGASDVQQEWTETRRKAAALLQIISKKP